MRRFRTGLAASACSIALVAGAAHAARPKPGADTAAGAIARSQLADAAGTIAAIKVVGNRRIEASTVLSYLLVSPGQKFNQQQINLSLKTLYATGLFKTVSITRQGDDLIVHVQENPVVNQVFFRGNKAVNDKDLQKAISLSPGSVFTPEAAAGAVKQILAAYGKHSHYDASVTPQIVKLPQNRVNVVFQCHDGPATFISRINFVGITPLHFSQSRLRDVVSSSQHTWWRFYTSSDEYNPDRVKYDEALLQRFYYHHGFANFQIRSASAQLAPDRKSFYLTFVLDPGPRYHYSSVKVTASVRGVHGTSLEPLVPMAKGDLFDGDAIQDTVKKLSERVQNEGHVFAEVEPDITQNNKAHTVALDYKVIEGPHVYVANVDIHGNTRTEDSVIRRQVLLAPGDAYNQRLVKDSKTNLENLGFFKKNVTVKPSPGPQKDEVNLNVAVQDKATGQFSLGGGYSTDLGALANIGLSQNNFIGTGINASINVLLAQHGTQFNIGVTNPYFLGRNLIAGIDLFRTTTYNTAAYVFSEKSIGGDVRLGYRFNRHVSQAFTYTLASRDIYNVLPNSSVYIQSEAGTSTLSQIGQTLTFNYLNNDIEPSAGTEVKLSTDFAGLGGDAKYLRLQLRAKHYFPLEYWLGDGWYFETDGDVGDLIDLFGYQSTVADRFYLGGDNLLGFQTGGAGPHDTTYGDSLGGKFMYTADAVMHFPLPVSKSIGISGFAFVDTGSLTGVDKVYVNGAQLPVYDNPGLRVSAGVGVAWNTPFGLIDLSFAEPIKKYKYDQTEQFRVSFGTRF